MWRLGTLHRLHSLRLTAPLIACTEAVSCMKTAGVRPHLVSTLLQQQQLSAAPLCPQSSQQRCSFTLTLSRHTTASFPPRHVQQDKPSSALCCEQAFNTSTLSGFNFKQHISHRMMRIIHRDEPHGSRCECQGLWVEFDGRLPLMVEKIHFK